MGDIGLVAAMDRSVALFFAGFSGALCTMFLLLSFGTDYWLLGSESCDPGYSSAAWTGRVAAEGYAAVIREDQDTATFFHEGFLWRCSFRGKMEEDHMWKFWITNQPSFKVCTQAYLFSFPVPEQSHSVTAYDSAIGYRGFWSVFIMVGIVTVMTGGFLTICGSAFASHQLYKAGGGLFLTGGLLLLSVVVMYVVWVQVLDSLEQYAFRQRASVCSGFHLGVHYGPSFMLAPVGVFFCLLAGLLFLLVGRSMQTQQLSCLC